MVKIKIYGIRLPGSNDNLIKMTGNLLRSFLGGSVVKNLPANAGDARDTDSIPGLGRSPGIGNGNPLWYSCLENPRDRGAWWAIVHGLAQSWMWLSTHAHVKIILRECIQYICKL